MPRQRENSSANAKKRKERVGWDRIEKHIKAVPVSERGPCYETGSNTNRLENHRHHIPKWLLTRLYHMAVYAERRA